uniref:Uncharacterized protein n=1 Tax=Candidatus Kentrum sp. LFY TaxID=2126342 RepID=A0A450V5H9_9GAMM|nr:MAG: hypothetical protein BECKLFY1418B_GA0070995_11671 [Candidatus Kentron sp. LFY]
MANFYPQIFLKSQKINTFNRLQNHIDGFGLTNRLRAFNVATKELTGERRQEAGYFILFLDLDKKIITCRRFKRDQLSKAAEYSSDEEEKCENEENKDLVMISANSIKDLKKAYPNYFADTQVFERNLRRVYEHYGKKYPVK